MRVQRQFQINFRATVELLQAALPAMKAQGWGRVLTIGSINQVRPEPDLAIYAALKSAQHNLCINLARQYAPFNVMINNLSPGLVATERNRWRRQDAEEWRNIQAALGKTHRARRGARRDGGGRRSSLLRRRQLHRGNRSDGHGRRTSSARLIADRCEGMGLRTAGR